MPGIFTKPLEELSPDDLGDLLNEQFPEGSLVEYKRDLPAKSNEPDKWWTGANQIGERARNELLKEIVAFANAHGGHLFIGIVETKTEPRCAESLAPLPRAAELATKIRMQARDCIDPQLPQIHSHAIPIGENGEGVVVVRVPASRDAPHRLFVAENNCYMRRADRSEKMTMREIQDLTLFKERGFAAINSLFKERAQMFAQRLPGGNENYCNVGMRATAVPLGDLYLDDVYGRKPGFSSQERTQAEVDGQRTCLYCPRTPRDERPQLRGTVFRERDDGWTRGLEVFKSGVIEEFGIRTKRTDDNSAAQLPLSWVLGCVLSVFRNLESFRLYAGAPELEYGLEVELIGFPQKVDLFSLRLDDGGMQTSLGELPGKHTVLPRYSVTTADNFSQVLSEVMRDCADAVGHRPQMPPNSLRLL